MRYRFAPVVLALAAISCQPLVAQRDSVKTGTDAQSPKVVPPSNTPGGSNYKKSDQGGPEKGGKQTAGAGTMATTDTEDTKPGKAGADQQAAQASKDGKESAKEDGKDVPGGSGPGGGGRRRGPGAGAPAGEGKAEDKVAYDYGLPSADGKNIPLSEYKGKVLLIVNLGRLSSYNAQLAGLEKLNQTFKDKGLVLIGVPSNDFGNAEPGTPAEVAKAYTDSKVDFLVTHPAELTGIHQLPLYGYLTKEKSITNNGVSWTYTKFLVDRKGKVILRFGPDVAPDSLEMQANVQAVLDGTWKPKKERPRRGEGGEGGDGPT